MSFDDTLHHYRHTHIHMDKQSNIYFSLTHFSSKLLSLASKTIFLVATKLFLVFFFKSFGPLKSELFGKELRLSERQLKFGWQLHLVFRLDPSNYFNVQTILNVQPSNLSSPSSFSALLSELRKHRFITCPLALLARLYGFTSFCVFAPSFRETKGGKDILDIYPSGSQPAYSIKTQILSGNMIQRLLIVKAIH